MLEDFRRHRCDVGGVTINAAVAGSGPPLLLLHGYPQNLAMWHQVAPELCRDFTVVASDLRGYGDSSAPPDDANHVGHSFRAMAADQVSVMRSLGFHRFAVVGHDRGARTAHRMCLDHPATVDRVALLDILPTRHVLSEVDRHIAQRYYHWFMLTQAADLPERLIGGDPLFFLHRTLGGLGTGLAAFHPAALAEYERCFTPATVHSICEDYRAAATIDQDHDEADRDRRLAMPVLVLWGSRGVVGSREDPLEVWRRYADDVRGHAIDAGHFLVEERPTGVLAALHPFLADAPAVPR